MQTGTRVFANQIKVAQSSNHRFTLLFSKLSFHFFRYIRTSGATVVSFTRQLDNMVTEKTLADDDQLGVTRFIPLNGVPTKILIYDEKLQQQAGGQTHVETPFNYDRLILMISGNPGEIEYYRNYLARVHQLTKLPVIGVSNSGHNRAPSWLSMPGVFGKNV